MGRKITIDELRERVATAITSRPGHRGKVPAVHSNRQAVLALLGVGMKPSEIAAATGMSAQLVSSLKCLLMRELGEPKIRKSAAQKSDEAAADRAPEKVKPLPKKLADHLQGLGVLDADGEIDGAALHAKLKEIGAFDCDPLHASSDAPGLIR